MQRKVRIDEVMVRPDTDVRYCDHPGCAELGEHRAPKDRDRLEEYYWFCLDHVRLYNKTWNYCRGMNQHEIEVEIRKDSVWRRPSWPFAGRGETPSWRHFSDAAMGDDFGPFRGAGEGGGPGVNGGANGSHARQPGYDTPERRALEVMDLEMPLTLTSLKARYKELVKRHHPDMNGGDKTAEERLKDINDAYATLKKIVAA